MNKISIPMLIDNIIEEFAEKKRVFSSWDIMGALKHRFQKNDIIWPNDLSFRADIHSSAKKLKEYTRTEIRLAKNGLIYIYHPKNNVIAKVKPQPLNKFEQLIEFEKSEMVMVDDTDKAPLFIPLNKSHAQIVPTVKTYNIGNKPKDPVIKPDARGSICIPQALVKKMLKSNNAGIFNKAIVTSGLNRLFIFSDVNSNLSKASRTYKGDINIKFRYTIDRNYNIRITRNTLSKLDLVHNKYVCYNNDDVIVVEKI